MARPIRASFKVEGLRQCEQALAELPKATSRNVVRRALMAAAAPIEKAAEERAPKSSGRLERSITVGTKLSKRQRSKHRKQSPVEVFVGAGPLSWAHMQEFGTDRHGPQPFLRPAVDAQGKNSIKTFVRVMREEIGKSAARLARKAARLAAKIRASR